MSDLRKLIDHLEHINRGGEIIRERDLKTGRIISKPVTEALMTGSKKWPATDAEIRAFQQANPPLRVDGLIGQQTLAQLQQQGYVAPQGFKPAANKAASAGASVPNNAGNSQLVSVNNVNPNGLGPSRNTSGTASNGGTGIDPNADPAEPATWPPGIKPASDFGYLDPNGMWIPTPFHVRNENGDFKIPRNSPANLIGIQVRNYTPFQQKVQQMRDKVVYLSSSAIEQTKPVQLPGGAPQIPGYTPVDPSQFSTNSDEGKGAGPKNMNWLYAYRSGKNFILIAPMLFYNTKLSIGRHYQNWGTGELRSGNGLIKTANGTIHVAAQDFNANDMILDVVIHSTDPNIGPKILQNIKI